LPIFQNPLHNISSTSLYFKLRFVHIPKEIGGEGGNDVVGLMHFDLIKI